MTELQDNREWTALQGVAVCFGGLLLSIVAVATSNSIVLVGDLFNSILEFLAITIAFGTHRALRRTAAPGYNYGLGKIESVAGFLIGLFIVASILVMAFLIWHRLLYPQALQGAGVWVGIVCTLVFGSLNAVLLRRTVQQRRRSPGLILDAQARLFAIKVFANALMFVSFVAGLAWAEHDWARRLDPAVSLLVTGFLVGNAYRILTVATRQLLDRALEEPLQLVIDRNLARHFEEYVQFHGIRSRYAGQTIFIEIFLEFDGARPMRAVQAAMDALARDVAADIPGAQVLVIPSSGRPGATATGIR